ncbi:hypothetical protein BH24ACT22_BH24ACT22_07050 [soil metagenome]
MRGKRPSAASTILRGLRSFECRAALLGVLSATVVGPLRGLADSSPVLMFLATFVLFMGPGVLLTRWVMGSGITGGVLIPVAFVFSAGVFGILGVPLLLMGLSIEAYLWASGALLLCFLIAALIRAFLRVPPTKQAGSAALGPLEWVLWLLFSGMCAVLAYASRLRMPDIYEDIWVYIAWVREFADAKSLASHEPYLGERIEGLSRAKINGWLLEQAAISRVSGLDPVEMVLDYLTPALVVISLLSLYALSRVLLKNEVAALLTGCVCAVFFLAHLGAGIHGVGGELIGRAAEDKLVTRFSFMPVALILAALFLESFRLRYLVLFGLVVWSVVVIHPIGLPIIGLAVGSFCLVYLTINLRRKRAWVGTASLGSVLASAVVPPAILLLVGGQAAALYSADINSGDPRILANMVFVRPEWRHIYELGNGYYIMHPYLLLNPAVAAAYLFGIPFLLFHLRRSLAAQMLFGILVFVALLVYVPPVATFFGNQVIIPGQLWRMAWPIPLAALLTLGWIFWKLTTLVAARLNRSGFSEKLTKYVPALLVVTLALAVMPLAVSGALEVKATSDPPIDVGYPADPIFPWIRENLNEPSVVLAPDSENTTIPAYSSSADVVSLRGGAILNNLPALKRRIDGDVKAPRRALDVQKFYSGPTFDEARKILRRYDVDYVMVYKNTPQHRQIEGLLEFEPIKTPGERYKLFRVDL